METEPLKLSRSAVTGEVTARTEQELCCLFLAKSSLPGNHFCWCYQVSLEGVDFPSTSSVSVSLARNSCEAVNVLFVYPVRLHVGKHIWALSAILSSVCHHV